MRKPWVWSLLALFLMMAGLHPWNYWWLGWLAFIPLFALALNAPRLDVILTALGCGFLCCGFGFWGLLSYEPRVFLLTFVSTSPLLALFFLLYLGIISKHKTPSILIVAAPLTWITFEKILSFTPIGTISTGVFFRGPLEFYQLTPLLGFQFHEAIIMGFNVSLAALISRKPKSLLWTSLFAALIAANGFYGHLVLNKTSDTNPERPLRALLIQHNLRADVEWRVDHINEIRGAYRELAAEAGKSQTDLVIFPSYDIDDDIWRKPELFADLPPLAQAPVLLGTYIRTQDTGDYDFYDMALLFDQNGQPLDSYHAIAPPPFRKIGEVRSNEYKIIHAPFGGIGMFLCYENGLARMAKKAVNHGAEIFVSLSNPIFFNQTGIPYYHFAQNQLRSLESGRYLIQVSEAGFSGVIDPQGRVLAKTNLNEKILLPVKAGLLKNKTLFHTFDILGWMSILLTLGLFLRKSGVAGTSAA